MDKDEIKDPKEFMSNLKLALFPEEVYVFTPNGDVKSFPRDHSNDLHTHYRVVISHWS